MNRPSSLVITIAFFCITSAQAAPKPSPEEVKRDAALKAIHVEGNCKLTLSKLNFAMPDARERGISQADAVNKIQTIASDSNKGIVRFMAIRTYYGADEKVKTDLIKYCTKQLAKRSDEELQQSADLLDGGNAFTLFVD